MEEDTVYLVSSFHRSGSSMMMRCLHGGGMNARYDNEQDELNIVYGRDGYKPNPNGFYALSLMADTPWPSFYLDNIGRLIKYPRFDFTFLTRGKYKMIFMNRSTDEIFASMKKFMPYQSWGMPMVAVLLHDVIKPALLRTLIARGDFEILEVEYSDVIKDPVKEFNRIKDFGFNIDVEKAAALVDPSLYRLRLE